MKARLLLLLFPLLVTAVTDNSQNTDNNPPPANTDPAVPSDAVVNDDGEIPHQTAWMLGQNECTAWPHVSRFFVRRWSTPTTSWISPNSVSQSLPAPPSADHGPEGCGCSGGVNGRFEDDVYGPVEHDHLWTWMADWADHPQRVNLPYRAWIPDVWVGGGPCPRLTRWNSIWRGFPGETLAPRDTGFRFAGAVEKEMRRADEIDQQLIALLWPAGDLPAELAPFDEEVFSGLPTYSDLRAAWGRWVQRSLDRRGRIVYELFWGEQRDWIIEQLPDVWVELRRLDYWGRSPLGAWFYNTRESAEVIRRLLSYGVPVVYRWIPEFDADADLRDLAPRAAPAEDLETLPLTPPNRRNNAALPRLRDTPYTHRHSRRAYFDTPPAPAPVRGDTPAVGALPAVEEGVDSTQDDDSKDDDAISLGLSSVERFEAEHARRNSTPPPEMPRLVADAVVVDSGLSEQFNVFVRARRDVIIEAISAEEAAVRYRLQPDSFRPIPARLAAERYGLEGLTFSPPPRANEGASGSSLAVENAVPARTFSSSPRSAGSSSRGGSRSSSRGGASREPALLARMRSPRPASAAGSSFAGASLSERLSAPGVVARDDSSDSQAASSPPRAFANTPTGVHEPDNGHAEWTFVLVDSGPATDRFRAQLETGTMATHEARVRFAVANRLPFATAFLHVAYRGQARSYDNHAVPDEWFIRENASPMEARDAWRLGVFRILRRGHARAALARGGLLARIAEMAGLTVNDALNGPSEDVRTNGSPYMFRTLGGRDLVDDWLSEDEVSILIGRYGRGGNASLWPSPRILYRGNDDEAWTANLEAWFLERWQLLHGLGSEDIARSHKSWRGYMKLLNEKHDP